MLTTESRICRACSKEIRGRTDKKFCDDYCRNHYNNMLKSGDNKFVRNVINALRKNRMILQDLLGNKLIAKARLNHLQSRGFQFTYHTDTYQSKKGRVYVYCFEYGYLPVEQDFFLIVKRKVHSESDD